MASRKVAVKPDEVETLACGWVTAKILCDQRSTASSSMSAVTIFFDPGKGHARHNHPEADQIIYVLAGQGEMMIEFEEGRPSKQSITPGDLVFIPRGAYHSTFNTGWEPIRILAVYSPAGPETYMRESPEFKVVSPTRAPADF
jgi:oxalate decarboxylase/phosphoglucose isomerase-like protein (cupin superfamily)